MTSRLPDNLRGVLPTGSDWQHRELQLSILDFYVALKNYVSNKLSKIGANPTFPKMFFSFKTCSNTSVSGCIPRECVSLLDHLWYQGIQDLQLGADCSWCTPFPWATEMWSSKRGGRLDLGRKMIYRYYSKIWMDQCWTLLRVFCSQESIIVALENSLVTVWDALTWRRPIAKPRSGESATACHLHASFLFHLFHPTPYAWYLERLPVQLEYGSIGVHFTSQEISFSNNLSNLSLQYPLTNRNIVHCNWPQIVLSKWRKNRKIASRSSRCIPIELLTGSSATGSPSYEPHNAQVSNNKIHGISTSSQPPGGALEAPWGGFDTQLVGMISWNSCEPFVTGDQWQTVQVFYYNLYTSCVYHTS